MSEPSIELATGYVSLASSSRGLGKTLIADLKGARRGLSVEGAAGGAAYQDSFTKRLGSRLGGGIKTALVGGTAVGMAAVGATIAKGFGRLTAIENAEAKLRGLGNSAADITSIMNDALTAVRGTAFAMDEAATVAATAVAAGVKPGKELENYLRLTADAATIAGTSMSEMGAIINKTTTNGKVYTEELQQLAERGLPVWQWLQEEYGVSADALRDMVSKGEIDAARFRKAIDENIGGAALSSGDTTVGAWKNMGASISRIGANLIKGVFPQIKSGIQGVTGTLTGIEPIATRIGEKVGGAFGQVADGVRTMVSSLGGVERLGQIRDDVRDLVPQLQTGLVPALTQVSPLFAAVSGAVRELQPHVPVIAGGFMQLGAALGGALAAALPNVLNIGSQLVPVLAGIAGGAASIIPPVAGAASGLVEFLQPVLASETAVKVLGGTILGIIAALKIYQVTTAAVAAVQTAYRAVTATIAGVQAGYTLATYGAVGATYAQTAAQKAGVVAQYAVRAATLVATAVQWAWNAALSANPIGIVIVAIAALVAGLIWFFTQTELGRQVFATAMAAIQTAVGAVVGFFQSTVLPIFQAVFAGISEGVQFAQRVFAAVMQKITSDFQFVGSIISSVYNGYIKPIFDLFAAIVRWVAIRVFQASIKVISVAWKGLSAGLRVVYNTVIRPVIDFFARRVADLRRGFAIVMAAIRLAFSIAANGIRSIYNSVIRPVIGFFADRIADLRRGFSIAIDGIRSAWGRVRDTLVGVYRNNIRPIFSAFSDLIGKVKSAFATAVDAIGVAWNGLKEKAKEPIKFVINTVINGLIGKFNEIARFFGSGEMQPLSLPPGFKGGGTLPGSTSGPRDKYTVFSDRGEPVALVEPGEEILPRWMSPLFGSLERIRQMGPRALRGFKDGGRFWPGTTHALSGNYQGHSGIDIPDPRGAPIYAMGDGQITYAGWGRGYGNAIFQSLAGGLQAVYGHTLRTLAQAGQIVRGGQKIALVDSTGRSSGDHIHAEINGAGGFGSAGNRNFTINWLKGAVSGFTGAGTEGSNEEAAGFDPLAALKSVFGAVVNTVGDLTAPLRDMVGNLLRGIGSSPFAQMAAKVPGKVVQMAVDKVKSLFDTGSAGNFGNGTGHVNGAAGAVARRAAAELGPKFGFSDIGTYAGHDPSEARALDFMTKTKGQGDALFNFMREQASRLGVMYLIWYRKIWSVARSREGLRDYNRSNPHTDHVHASFYENGGLAQRGLGIVGERRAELIDFDHSARIYPDALAMLENAAKVMQAVQTIEATTSSTGSSGVRFAFVITNWKTGEGYFRELAADEARQDSTYDGLIDRMGG